MYFLSDAFPTWGEESQAKLRVECSGHPTVGSALLRFVMVIPIAIFLYVISTVGFVMMLIAGVSVLVSETIPEFVKPWQRKLLQLGACVLGCYASPVEEYPPSRWSPLPPRSPGAALLLTAARSTRLCREERGATRTPQEGSARGGESPRGTRTR